MQSDTLQQPFIASPSVVSQPSTVDQQVMEHFTQIETMLSSIMDNYFTGRCDRSRQMPEKDVLYIIPVGPVTERAFARWRIVLPSCLDSMMS